MIGVVVVDNFFVLMDGMCMCVCVCGCDRARVGEWRVI